MAEDVRELTLALLNARAAGATLCPSEVARALVDNSDTDAGPLNWRGVMPSVHAAIDQLVAEGAVRLSWKETHSRREPGRTGSDGALKPTKVMRAPAGEPANASAPIRWKQAEAIAETRPRWRDRHRASFDPSDPNSRTSGSFGDCGGSAARAAPGSPNIRR